MKTNYNCLKLQMSKPKKLKYPISKLWQYRLLSFQTGGAKLERFLPKNQHTQRKLLNFENWVNGEVSKIQSYVIKSAPYACLDGGLLLC